MGGGGTQRTRECVFRDLRARRAGMIKELTTDVEKLYRHCEPEKENLCLYGLPNEAWEVNLHAKEVPLELPEPALGLNFSRDGVDEKDWLFLVAVHSDALLLALAFYFGARFGFDKESRANLMKLPHYKDEFLMKHGEKFGSLSWFVKTVVPVLQNRTIMNAVTDGDNVVYKDYIDVRVAVGTTKGLVVSAIRDSDTRNFADIKKDVNNLAKKPTEVVLPVDKMAEGTFIISSYAFYGSVISTPVISPLQCHKKNSQDNNKQVDLAGRAQKINILVRLLSGRTACICLWKTDHIGQLMSHIEDWEGIPKMHMKLLYGRTTLEYGCLLSEYNMENNCTVNVMLGLRGGCPDLNGFFSNKQRLFEYDEWTPAESWLTNDAKRKIHSTYHMIFLLHKENLCLGSCAVKDIPIYLDRARMPPQAGIFTVDEGKKDYNSFIAYLREVFGTPLPKELKHFLDALDNMPDVCDQDYHKYLYCNWGLMTSERRSDFIIDIAMIYREGNEGDLQELLEIITPLVPDNWFEMLKGNQPFLDKHREGKLADYTESKPEDILKFMRDLLEHPQPKYPTGNYRCNRLQLEKVFYCKFWEIWDAIIRSLIDKKSDLSKYIENYVTY